MTFARPAGAKLASLAWMKIKTYRKSKIREAKYQEKSTFFNLIRTWQEDKKASLQGVPLKSLVFGLRRPSVSCFLGRILQESPRRKRKEQELLERRWSSIFHRSKKRVEQLLSSLWGCYSAGTKKRNWRKKRCNHFHFYEYNSRLASTKLKMLIFSLFNWPFFL